jgi:SET domain
MMRDKLSLPFTTMSGRYSVGLVFLLVLSSLGIISKDSVVQASSSSTLMEDESQAESSSSSSWQNCNVFLAPSLVNKDFGWGVFAGRSFAPREIIEVAPLVLPFEADNPLILNSVLHDYVYGYYRLEYNSSSSSPDHGGNNNEPRIHLFHSVLFGSTMYANHQPDGNVKLTTFGREPVPNLAPNATNAMGLVATRAIQAGEELFTSYGSGKGDEWFSDRGLSIQVLDKIEQGQIRPDSYLSQVMSQYCSKIYAGLGSPTWNRGILSILPPSFRTLPPSSLPFWMNDKARLAPIDAGLGHAMAKMNVQAGDRLEIVPAFVVHMDVVQGTPIAPLTLQWYDFANHPELRAALGQLRRDKELQVQYQGPTTNWKSLDGFTSLEDTVLLPVAGNIGLVRRVGSRTGPFSPFAAATGSSSEAHHSNCRLMIHSSLLSTTAKKRVDHQFEGLGVILELVATKAIKAGEELLLDLPPPGSTVKEDAALIRELQLTGQPYRENLFRTTRDEKGTVSSSLDDEL